MTRLTIAALCLLTAAHAQTIVGPAAGSTVLTLPASTPATVSDSWLTVTPGAVTYTANPNPNARIATVTAAGVKYPIVQASATGILTPWGPLGYGNIRTIAGLALSGFSGDNGPAVTAQLDSPEGIAIDANANVYIADMTEAIYAYNTVLRDVAAVRATPFIATLDRMPARPNYYIDSTHTTVAGSAALGTIVGDRLATAPEFTRLVAERGGCGAR